MFIQFFYYLCIDNYFEYLNNSIMNSIPQEYLYGIAAIALFLFIGIGSIKAYMNSLKNKDA